MTEANKDGLETAVAKLFLANEAFADSTPDNLDELENVLAEAADAVLAWGKKLCSAGK